MSASRTSRRRISTAEVDEEAGPTTFGSLAWALFLLVRRPVAGAFVLAWTGSLVLFGLVAYGTVTDPRIARWSTPLAVVTGVLALSVGFRYAAVQYGVEPGGVGTNLKAALLRLPSLAVTLLVFSLVSGGLSVLGGAIPNPLVGLAVLVTGLALTIQLRLAPAAAVVDGNPMKALVGSWLCARGVRVVIVALSIVSGVGIVAVVWVAYVNTSGATLVVAGILGAGVINAVTELAFARVYLVQRERNLATT